MKLRYLASILGALCSLLHAHAQPLPARQTTLPGTYRISAGTQLSYETPLAPLAGYLREYINVGKASDSMSADDAIVLTTDPTLGSEAYTLAVKPQRIEITGGDYGGVFNGIQALLRLLPPEVYAKACPLPVEVACTRIDDAPRFAYRGMMLDVARTWIGVDGVKRYINLLSYHGINKLHLHLSDDEGWRIEIRSHPELTEIGGFRGGDSPVRPVYGKWDEKYGGFYTQDEMRGLIRYAAVRNIEIIPEIDLPGHSRNIASVHPEIRCNYPPDTLSTNGYDYRSAWCVAREENYALLADILGELCTLFPSEYIHVGGDEVDMTQWKRCPDCQALMRQRGMADPHQLEDLFMQRMAAILGANGKRPAVWNEAVATGDLAHDSRVYGWQSVKACLDATAKGYETVVMPGEYFYFDMRQTPHEDGHDWAAVFDAKKVFGFDFTDKGFGPEQMRNVVGLQAAFFSEAYVSHEPEKPDYLDYMCFPRICALARIAWRGNGEGWDAYYKGLVEKHYDRMAAMGIRFRLFPPKVSYKEGAFTDGRRRVGDILHGRRRARRTPLYPSRQDRQTAPVPLLHPLQNGAQPLCRRQILLPHARTRRGHHHLDGREQAVPPCQCRGLQGTFADSARLPAARLGALHLRAAGEMPRNVPPDREPPAAEDHHNHRLCRGVVRRCDV